MDDFKHWIGLEITVCRETRSMSEDGLIRHIKDNAKYFGYSRDEAERITLHLMKDNN